MATKEPDMSGEKESKSPSSNEQPEEAAEDKGGAPVPEQFQKDVYELVQSCSNDEMLDFIQDCVSKKQMEDSKKKTQEMDTYSDEDMPKE